MEEDVLAQTVVPASTDIQDGDAKLVTWEIYTWLPENQDWKHSLIRGNHLKITELDHALRRLLVTRVEDNWKEWFVRVSCAVPRSAKRGVILVSRAQTTWTVSQDTWKISTHLSALILVRRDNTKGNFSRILRILFKIYRWVWGHSRALSRRKMHQYCREL